MGEVYIAKDTSLNRRRFFVLSLVLPVLPASGFGQRRAVAQQSHPNIVFKVIKPGTVRDELALNIDLAPTLLSLARVPVPPSMQGGSLVPLLKGARRGWRNSFLIEYYSDKVFPRIVHMGYKAVRSERWKYIHYLELEGMDELYDLRTDPFEMKNRIEEPSARKALAAMKLELARLLKVTR